MAEEYADYEVTVRIKNCTEDFGLGVGVIGRKVVTPKTDNKDKIVWYLSDLSREMVEELVETEIKEVKGK